VHSVTFPLNHDTHKLALAAALRDLEGTLERFTDAIAYQQGPAAAEGARSEGEARRRVCEAWATIDYGQDDEVNRSPICLGVVGASAAVIDRAYAVNEAKARLRSVCAPLQNLRVRLPVKDGEGGRVVKSLPLVRVILRELQRSDLNLLAAYRKVPILTGRVARVHYTRAHTRAVYRKTRAGVAALLEASSRPAAAADLARLRQLPTAVTHLALVKERQMNVRANVWFDGLDSRNRGRVQITAELPILYPHGRSLATPAIRYPSVDISSAEPAVQRTGKLETERFLETVPVYRYRTEPPAGAQRRR